MDFSARDDDASVFALSELIEKVYGAGFQPSSWSDVLSTIGGLVKGTQILLFRTGGDDGHDEVLRCHGTPDSVLYPFLEHYASVNVLAEPCDRLFPEGTPRFSHQALDDAEFEHSEFYEDFFKKNDLYYSFGVKQHTVRGALNYLSVQRPRHMGPFGEREGRMGSLLFPHIQRSLHMQAQRQDQAKKAQDFDAALSAFGKLVISIDSEGRIRAATTSAEALLREGRVLFAKGGRLKVCDPATDTLFQQRLRAVLELSNGFLQPKNGALLIRHASLERALKISIVPRRHASEVGALVCIAIGEPSNLSRAGSLRALYNLTPTECRIADLLAKGKEVKDIAASMNMTSSAARFHLKRVFSKTGVSRQTQLIHMLADIPADPETIR